MCADQVVNPTAPHRITSAQVREASEAALAAVLQTITAPELLKIMTRIHAAHLQPHADAEALINDLLEVSRLASSQRGYIGAGKRTLIPGRRVASAPADAGDSRPAPKNPFPSANSPSKSKKTLN